MVAACEFEFFEDKGWVLAFPFGLEGGTQGRDTADAARMAVDWLKGEVEHSLMCGTPLLSPTFGNVPMHGGTVSIVSIETLASGRLRRDYPAVLRAWRGETVLVGMTYDEKTGRHEAKIERPSGERA